MFLYSSVLTCYLIKMKNIILVLFLTIVNLFVFGQEKKVNNYKFIVVPDRFDFLKQKDEYKTSSLTKFLFKKNGFTVFLNSEQYPKDLIELRDCSNRLLYTSEEGVSKLKEFKKGFQEAIRNAHASMNDVVYEPFLLETIGKEKKEIELEVEFPVINNIEEAAQVSPTNNIALDNTLYAQPKENGFQLINLKPQVVFVILNTGAKDIYVIKDKNGLLYKKGENWIAEFYEGGELVVKKYSIKF